MRPRCAMRVLLGALLLAASVAMAQGMPKPPPAELFFKPATVQQATLSPDGQRLAFLSASGNPAERVSLYVWTVGDPRARPQAVALFHDGDVDEFRWLGNGRLLFDVIDRSRGGMQQEAPGLYVVNADGSGVRELIMRGWLPRFRQPSIGRVPPLEPNHILLHVPALRDGRDPEEVIVGKMTWRDNHWDHVTPMRLNVRSGATSVVDPDAPSEVSWWLFDPQGRPRVAVVREGDTRRVHWRDADRRTWRVIDEAPYAAASWSPHSVGSEGELFVLSHEGEAGRRVLSRFDFTAGRPEATSFVTVPGFDFHGSLIRDPLDGRLLGVRVESDVETTVWLDPAMKALQASIDERVPGATNRIDCRRCDSSAARVVLVHSGSDRDPGQWWIWRGNGPPEQPVQPLARSRPGLDPAAMAEVGLVRIAARDGLELPVWLTVPPGRKAGDKGPAVVLVHGGPWVRGGFWRWDAQAQFLASRGYLVIEPEFRGSSGYGRRHRQAGHRQWGRAMQDDIADAARWAQAQGWADRFCIAGGSYGGYATLMGLVRDRDLYRCGAAWVPVADMFLFLEGSWWVDDDISSEGRRFDLKRRVGDPERDAEMLRAVSPVHQAARIDRPLLLVHGELDRRVPLAHTERLRKAMREAGREPEVVTYPGEGHGWLKLANQVDFANRLEAFFGKHLAAP